MQIRVCLTEREIAKDFFRSLQQGKLEERFFYWFPLSVLWWLRLCESKAYRNYARSLALAQYVSKKLARKVEADSVQWVSLGSGQGTKEVPFLEALLKAKKRVRYFPLDFSQSLLEMAVGEGVRRGIPTIGFKANFEIVKHFEAIPEPSEGEVQVVSLLGNTLGNLSRISAPRSGNLKGKPLLRTLSQRLRRGDFLLIDGELFSGEKETLAGYDHPVNRRFALAPLLSIGIMEEDGTLRFKLSPTPEQGVWALSKSFRFTRSKKIFYSGQFISFSKGKALQMSPSYKYDFHGMKKILERGGLFRASEVYKTRDSRFALWLARKT